MPSYRQKGKKHMVTYKDLCFSRGKKLYEGKANTIYSVLTSSKFDGVQTISDSFIELESTDRISAGNGEKRDVIEGKGLTNNKISTALFKLFEANGIPTHFVCEGTNEYSKIVRKADMIKLEVIGRFIAAGSCCKRYDVDSGKVFNNMTYELTYKNDALGDPFMAPTMAAELGVAPLGDLNIMEEYTYHIGKVAKEFFAQFNLTLVDFKVEFGYDSSTGDIILCDEFSPDTCRLWDESGKSFDKDVFRKGLGNVQETYKGILDRIQSK